MPTLGKDMAVEVREYFIPDFSTWKDHDAYKKAFDRLLRDLKATYAICIGNSCLTVRPGQTACGNRARTPYRRGISWPCP